MIKKIITGGQSGADLSGNVFADGMGIPTEINTHKEFRPLRREDITLLGMFKVNTVTTWYGARGLRLRTQYNVEHSDATIILSPTMGPGSVLTMNHAKEVGKPYIISDMNNPQVVADFLKENHPEILNIAGSRYLDLVKTVAFLEEVWTLYSAT